MPDAPPPEDFSRRHSLDRPPAGGLSAEKREAYWRRNLRLVVSLLLVWGAASFGCSILLHDWLDQWTLPGSGFPLGFWFAQQGSLLVFIAIVFIYAWRMNKLDREFGAAED
jgi:putative solute:sodium symporter small subunit